jgi:predicted ester cyclase
MRDGDGTAAAVSEVGYRDIGELLPARAGRAQPLAGFEDGYADIVHYIIRCTHRIWEEKAVGLIDSHYSHNCVVHTPAGDVHGREAVTAATLQMLAAFPDRRLYGDAVVWGGDERAGYYSSHRLTNIGTNTGATAWGPPTGRRCTWRAIADCIVVQNRIVEEWLVRDDLHLCRQLGLDPHEVARALAATDLARGVPAAAHGEIARGLGQLPPEPLAAPAAEDAVATIGWHLHEIWNRRMLNEVRGLYAAGAVLHGPSGRRGAGLDEIIGLYLAVLAALPDLVFRIDHACRVDEAARGTQIALRWTIRGTHDGHGPFGAPSGKRVTLLGISHYRVAGGRVVEEWQVVDELAALRQIHRQLG